MQPSRRAFLLGRRPVQTPWARFIQRLTLLCQGAVRDLGEAGADGRAAGWRPRAGRPGPRPGAVRRVRRGPGAGRRGGNRRWSRCGWIPRTSAAWPAWPETPRWRAQPGVPLAVLAQAGLRQFDGLPGAMTLAEWLAAPAACRRDAARSPGSWRPTWCWPTGWRKPWGLLASDGPLRSATLQRLVPALFQRARGRTPPPAPWAAPGPVVTGWTRCGHRRPPRSTWRICCWGTAARWPGCRRCCSRPCRRPGKRRGGDAPPLDDAAGGGTPAGCPDQGAVRPGWSFSLTRFRAIAAVRGPRVRWAGPPARAGGRARPAPAAISRRPP